MGVHQMKHYHHSKGWREINHESSVWKEITAIASCYVFVIGFMIAVVEWAVHH
jgi:hypothetical protein